MDFAIDDNNNTSGEKSYSLRPRAIGKRNGENFEEEETISRPRSKSRKRQKQKSAPLSKYRRKTANARERSRMKEINDAFESLRKAIPHLASSCDNNNEKISKIMTLRLAMKYITALSNALEDPDSYNLDFQSNFHFENSSTSSSFSDSNTWRDQLFTTSSLEPTSVAPNFFSSNVQNNDTISKIGITSTTFSKSPFNLETENFFQGSFSHLFINRPTEISSRTSDHSLGSRFLEADRHILTPPTEPTALLPFDGLPTTFTSTSAIDFQSSASIFNPEFDGLPSPVTDFCDLFIT